MFALLKACKTQGTLKKIILEIGIRRKKLNSQHHCNLHTTQNLFSDLNESICILLRINKFKRLMKTSSAFLVSFDILRKIFNFPEECGMSWVRIDAPTKSTNLLPVCGPFLPAEAFPVYSKWIDVHIQKCN